MLSVGPDMRLSVLQGVQNSSRNIQGVRKVEVSLILLKFSLYIDLYITWIFGFP